MFAQASLQLTAFSYIGALLAEYAWDWKAALAALQRFIVAQLGDPGGDRGARRDSRAEEGDRLGRRGPAACRITGQVENCQTVVFAACVTARAHVLSDFRLYLPKAWCAGRARREKAAFTTKPALGTQMITGAADAGIPFAGVAGDEVYGRSS